MNAQSLFPSALAPDSCLISCIILCSTMLISLIALWRFRWRDYLIPYLLNCKNKRSHETDTASKELPKISIILPAHNQAHFLEKNLPLLLEQDYPAFEVIVADEASTDETADVLKRLEKNYTHLRHTFVPSSARYVGRKKLAITLGIRAARSEWCLLTEPDCQPVSTRWLRYIGNRMNDGTDFILGYATYLNNDSRTARRAIYERLRYQLRCFRAGINGKAIGADGCNLGIRKSRFMEMQGFAKSLAIPFGEATLLTDALSGQKNTIAELHDEAMTRQELPQRHILLNERIYHQETLRHISGRGRLFRLRESCASWFTWIFTFSTICYVALRTTTFIETPVFPHPLLYTDAAFLLLLAFALIIPVILLRKSTNSMGERPFGATLYWYALIQPIRNLLQKIRCYRHRKEFVRDLG